MLRSALGLRSDRVAGEQPAAPASATQGGPPGQLLDPALVPVASECDARRTAEVLLPYLRENEGSAVVVHVVERRAGWPEPISPGMQVSAAERMFEVVTEAFRDAGVPVETRLFEGSDVAGTILSAAADLDAASIAFVRRGGSRLVKLLAGNVERGLLDGGDCPVLVFAPDERSRLGSTYTVQIGPDERV